MSGKELAPVPLQQIGNALNAPPLAVQDADPLRFRVGDPDPKTREFAAFIGDQQRYFAAAAAAAAAATTHPHPEFRKNFYSENLFRENPHDSGGSDGDDDVDEDDEDDDEMEGDGRQSEAANRNCAGEGSSAGAVTVADPENAVLYLQHFKTIDASSVPRLKDTVTTENGSGVSGRQEASSTSNSMASLKAMLSDPITGILMNDAMILPCGHSFGTGGIEQVKQLKACCTCSQPVSENSIIPNLSLRVAVQAFSREESLHLSRSKRKREGSEQHMCSFGGSPSSSHSRSRSTQFPYVVSDRVIIKGNKRTPPRFVGREAIVTAQCLNGWYVVKTLDNAESVKLQYSSLAKGTPSKMVLSPPSHCPPPHP